LDYEKLKNTVQASSLSVGDICSKVGIQSSTYYDNLSKKNMRVDVLEKICEVLKVEVTSFFPQTISSKKRANIQIEIDESDHISIDLHNKKLTINKL
jgi:transcriptional regulator with XRE-family HTH domain